MAVCFLLYQLSETGPQPSWMYMMFALPHFLSHVYLELWIQYPLLHRVSVVISWKSAVKILGAWGKAVSAGELHIYPQYVSVHCRGLNRTGWR